MSTKQEWTNYITKLNERTLQKKQTSGLTTYALLGALGLLIFKLINSLPLAFKSMEHTYLVLILFVICSNAIVWMVYLILCFTFHMSRPMGRKLINNLSNRINQIRIMPLILLIFILAASNLGAGLLAQKYALTSWPYFALAIWYAVVCTLSVKEPLVSRTRKWSNETQPIIETPILTSSLIRTSISGVYICLTLGLGLCIFIQLRDILLNNYVLPHIELLNIVFYAVCFITINYMLIWNISATMEDAWLANLERDIVTKNLKVSDIESRFKEEFLGQTVTDWLTTIQKTANKLFKDFSDRINAHSQKIDTVTSANISKNQKLTQVKQTICEIKKNHKQYLVYVKTNLRYIDSITSPQTLLTTDEIKIIQQIKSQIIKQLDAFKNELATLRYKCEQVKTKL